MGYDVIAVDSSATMLKRVQARVRKIRNLSDRDLSLTTLRTDGLDLVKKIPDPVDAVVCRAVLIHHSHKDVERLVTAFAAVLKPGGHLIADWPVGRHYERLNWIDVTTWDREKRLTVGEGAGLALVDGGTPSVWVKN